MNAENRGRIIETLSVLIIAVSLVAIGIPKVAELRRRDTATQMLADIDVLRDAVYRFYSDSALFPPEAPAGQIPEALVEYLPASFGTVRSYGTIEYRNWPLRPIVSDAPEVSASNVIAVTVVPRDPRIAATASAIGYAIPQFTIGNKFTFVIFGS